MHAQFGYTRHQNSTAANELNNEEKDCSYCRFSSKESVVSIGTYSRTEENTRDFLGTQKPYFVDPQIYLQVKATPKQIRKATEDVFASIINHDRSLAVMFRLDDVPINRIRENQVIPYFPSLPSSHSSKRHGNWLVIGDSIEFNSDLSHFRRSKSTRLILLSFSIW